MTIALGRYGVWQSIRDFSTDLARQVERLGYGTFWIGGAPGDLVPVEQALAATESLIVATGIVNVWSSPAEQVAEAYHRVVQTYPDRFVLGIGIGHPEATEQYRKPYDTLVDYLDRLDALEVPRERIVLAALRGKVLRLSADRTAGAHPYLVTPEHTRRAREIIGATATLAPEQKFVVGGPDEQTRAIARAKVENPYLHLSNYVRSLRDLGWSEADLTGSGSDELADALVLQGTPETIAHGVDAHLQAGADHVAVQAIGPDVTHDLAALAPALGLQPRS